VPPAQRFLAPALQRRAHARNVRYRAHALGCAGRKRIIFLFFALLLPFSRK